MPSSKNLDHRECIVEAVTTVEAELPVTPAGNASLVSFRNGVIVVPIVLAVMRSIVPSVNRPVTAAVCQFAIQIRFTLTTTVALVLNTSRIYLFAAGTIRSATNQNVGASPKMLPSLLQFTIPCHSFVWLAGTCVAASEPVPGVTKIPLLRTVIIYAIAEVMSDRPVITTDPSSVGVAPKSMMQVPVGIMCSHP